MEHVTTGAHINMYHFDGSWCYITPNANRCVKSATLVAIDETNIVAVDLTNVCDSRDSVVLCSLVTGHMHIIKDLAGGCRSSRR